MLVFCKCLRILKYFMWILFDKSKFKVMCKCDNNLTFGGSGGIRTHASKETVLKTIYQKMSIFVPDLPLLTLKLSPTYLQNNLFKWPNLHLTTWLLVQNQNYSPTITGIVILVESHCVWGFEVSHYILCLSTIKPIRAKMVRAKRTIYLYNIYHSLYRIYGAKVLLLRSLVIYIITNKVHL